MNKDCFKVLFVALTMLPQFFSTAKAQTLNGNAVSLQGATKVTATNTIADTPILIAVNIPGQGTDTTYFLLRIPLFLPHAQKAKSVKVRIFIEAEKTDNLANFCPDYTRLDENSRQTLLSKLSENEKDSPEIVSIYPVHQFLDAQYVHSKSASVTLSPSWAGASAGSATGTASKETSYSANLPKCIGTFDKTLHAVAWDYFQVKNDPIELGMVNQYVLIKLKAASTAGRMTSGGIDLFEPSFWISPIVIYNNDYLRPYFSKALKVDQRESIDQFTKEHFGELSSEEQDLFNKLSTNAIAPPDDHYDLILRKRDQ